MNTRPAVVQGSLLPVFQGRSAQSFQCSACGHVLVQGYELRCLIAVDIECFKCKSVTRTAEWPDHEPLPMSLVTLGDVGRFLIKGTVDMREGIAAFTCDQEIARVQAHVAPRQKNDSPLELTPESLSTLAIELDLLTDGAIKKMVQSAKRARAAGNASFAASKSPLVWALEQLNRAMAAGEINLDGPDAIAIAFIQTLRDSLRRWRQHPLFHLIAKSLCTEFHHAMTQFTVASYLSDHGNRVGITNTTRQVGRSPDLFINMGANATVSIEVKAPSSFFWPAPQPDTATIQERMERQIKKARKQITGNIGGIVVLGLGYFPTSLHAEVHECIKRLTVSGRVSTRIAAIAAVYFSESRLSIANRTEPRMETGGQVLIALNPRFVGSNPIRTQPQ